MSNEERLEQIKAKSSWLTSHDEREGDKRWLIEQVESLKIQVKHNFEAFYDKREENKRFREALEEIARGEGDYYENESAQIAITALRGD